MTKDVSAPAGDGPLVLSASLSQPAILRDIMDLHNGGQPFHADLTYSTGAFWRGLPQPKIRMDLERTGHSRRRDQQPRVYGAQNLQGDARALPFLDHSLESAVVDFPFVHAHGDNGIMGRRFSSYPNQRLLNVLHREAAGEVARVLVNGGLLVWKCQDIVEATKQVWNHVLIKTHVEMAGLEAIDLIVLLRRNVIVPPSHRRQQHARRAHCYFWVFRKPGKRNFSMPLRFGPPTL